jgi:hypothetical protein
LPRHWMGRKAQWQGVGTLERQMIPLAQLHDGASRQPLCESGFARCGLPERKELNAIRCRGERQRKALGDCRRCAEAMAVSPPWRWATCRCADVKRVGDRAATAAAARSRIFELSCVDA